MAQPDFIEVYDNALDAATCVALIRRFATSGQAVRGATGGGVDTALKDSWDIGISDHAACKDVEDQFNGVMLRGLMAYVHRYAYAVLAPLTLRMPDPETGERVLLDSAAIAALPDPLLQALVTKCFRPSKINLQEYIAGRGGYPYWHCEMYPKLGGDEPCTGFCCGRFISTTAFPMAKPSSSSSNAALLRRQVRGCSRRPVSPTPIAATGPTAATSTSRRRGSCSSAPSSGMRIPQCANETLAELFGTRGMGHGVAAAGNRRDRRDRRIRMPWLNGMLG